MALTISKSFPLGKKAHDFNLPDTVSGRQLFLNKKKELMELSSFLFATTALL